MEASLPLFYDWVKQTRTVLLEYTDHLPPEVYTLEHPDFAYGSIRNIQVHVARAYLRWVGNVCLKREWGTLAFDAESVPTAQIMRERFLEVDALLERVFVSTIPSEEMFEVVHPDGDTLRVSTHWLVMRPITHEFHHKGQMLALGRVLGHPLPSSLVADLVLP